MQEEKIHIWHKCSYCGIAPISGTRYHCTTCPASPETEFYESCYALYRNDKITHPMIETFSKDQKEHSFISYEGIPFYQYDKWFQVSQYKLQSFSITHGFLARPEFCCDNNSYFGTHGFIVEALLFITALHVLDVLIKKVSIDTTDANKNYTGHELSKIIKYINL